MEKYPEVICAAGIAFLLFGLVNGDNNAAEAQIPDLQEQEEKQDFSSVQEKKDWDKSSEEEKDQEDEEKNNDDKKDEDDEDNAPLEFEVPIPFP
jgi:hypothetical protein